MKKKELAVIIQEEIKNNVISGVYIVEFSDGHFYIGCSRDIRRRISSHISIIKSKPTEQRPRYGMERMAGFRGTVTFSLLQKVPLTPYSDLYFRGVLEAAEWKHISAHSYYTKFLNKRNSHIYGRKLKRPPLVLHPTNDSP